MIAPEASQRKNLLLPDSSRWPLDPDKPVIDLDDVLRGLNLKISHDMSSTFRIAHMIAMLHEGKIAAFGTPAELRASPNEHVQRFIHAGSVDVQ